MVSDAIIEHLTNRLTVSVQSSTVVGPPAEWPRSPANVQHQEMAETSLESARIWTRLRRYGQNMNAFHLKRVLLTYLSKVSSPVYGRPAVEGVFHREVSRVWGALKEGTQGTDISIPARPMQREAAV